MREKTSVSSGQILDKEADLLRTFVADNTALVGSALIRDRGFLNRLFPSPRDRLVRDHGLDHDEGRVRLSAAGIANGDRYQAAGDRGDV
jgi:hypothetical protein